MESNLCQSPMPRYGPGQFQYALERLEGRKGMRRERLIRDAGGGAEDPFFPGRQAKRGVG